MEYRIEQLGQAAGMAVDTIRFYQGKGLLEPPRREGRVTWYGPAHLERLGRIKALQQRGFTLGVIGRFLDGELESSDEALVQAVIADSAPETLTLEEMATRSGVPIPLLKNLQQSGLLVSVSGGDEPRYPARDLEAIGAGLKLVEAGVPLALLLELAAEHAASIERTAARAVDLFDHHVRERIQAEGLPAGEAERRLLRIFEELLDASGVLVRRHFERALLGAAKERIERRS